MLRVWKYSLGYTFRRKATTVFAVLVFLLTVFILTLLYKGLKSSEGGKIIFNHSKLEMLLGSQVVFTLLPSFVLLSSYIAIVVGQIFKRSASDGTTLLLVSSQFTRSQVILGRFFCVLTHLLIISALFGGATFLAALFVQPEKIGWEFISFLSTIFGVFFLGLIIAGLSLLLVLFLGRIGSLVSSIFIMVTLPITSLIMVTLSSNKPQDLQALNTSWNNSSSYNNIKHEYYIDDSGTDYAVQSVVENSSSHSDEFDALLNPKYNGLAWVDVWSQWSRMLGAFLPGANEVTKDDKIKAIDLTKTKFFEALKLTDGYGNANGEDTTRHSDSKLVFKLRQFLSNALPIPSSYTDAKYQYNYTNANRIDVLDKTFNLISKNIATDDFKNKLYSVTQIFGDVSAKNWTPGKDLNGVKLIVDGGKDQLFKQHSYEALANAIWEIRLKDQNFMPTSFNLNTLELIGTSASPNAITNYPLGDSRFIRTHNISNILEFDDANSVYNVLSSGDSDKILQWFAIYLGNFEAQKNIIATANFDKSTSQQNVSPTGQEMPANVTSQWEDKTQSPYVATVVKDVYDSTYNNMMYSKGTSFYLPSSDLNNFVNLTRAVGSHFSYSPIVPTAFICIFWPVVAIGLFGVVYWLHKRADFS